MTHPIVAHARSLRRWRRLWTFQLASRRGVYRLTQPGNAGGTLGGRRRKEIKNGGSGSGDFRKLIHRAAGIRPLRSALTPPAASV